VSFSEFWPLLLLLCSVQKVIFEENVYKQYGRWCYAILSSFQVLTIFWMSVYSSVIFVMTSLS
jgi:hypothetical protein